MPVPLEELKKTISGWIVEQKQARPNQKAPYRWVTGLVVGIVSLITLSLLAWQAKRKGQELASLKHDRDRLKQEEIRSRLSAENAKHQSRIDKHLEVYEAMKEEVSLLDTQIEKINQEERTALERIDAIKNWEEVDSYLDLERMPTTRNRPSSDAP